LNKALSKFEKAKEILLTIYGTGFPGLTTISIYIGNVYMD